jgi:pyruvate formate lyase activating enzyme
MGADRIFFSGGEPTIHLPYIEKIVDEARKIEPTTKVNYDTNGYMTEESLKRVLSFATSITYDLKAYHNEVHLALTGTPSAPILRNAEYIGKYAKDRLWEYRIVVIPKINENEIKPLTDFIAAIDPFLPVSFLAFRPNFILEFHPGADRRLMKRCVDIAWLSGLKNVYWSGYTDISGKIADIKNGPKQTYLSDEARLSGSYALNGGCPTHLRDCKACCFNQECQVKKYIPRLST